ncbi:MAG: hypothetical protein LBT05_02165, partial [Planctomycetaceae bacterium]|jgi:hypothetical protein|nr:hypothetical protein [Planctomycetaceae bacterium]
LTDVLVYGGTVSFPQVYNVAVAGNSFIASGSDAVLDLSNLASITGSSDANTTITAQNAGGKVKLTSLEKATDVIFRELDDGDLLFGEIPFPVV